MSGYDNDRAAVADLGVSEAFIGELLGKSRQAINYGLQQNKSYLKPHELMALLLACRSANNHRVSEFEAYIRATRPNSADQIITAHNNFFLFSVLGTSDYICGVIPDYRHLNYARPKIAHALLSLIAEKVDKFSIVTVDTGEKEALLKDLEALPREKNSSINLEKLDISVVPEANALPYMLFCDFPDRRQMPLVLVKDRFEEIDGYRGDAMFRFIDRFRNPDPKAVQRRSAS